MVVPVLDEQDNIPLLYERVVTATASICDELEIIFVDDGSTDESAARIESLYREDPRVKLLSFSRNFGHQTALTAGMDYAAGDAVVFMDADLQHPPEFIPSMVQKWRAGYHIVYTIRNTTQDAGWFKRMTASLFYALFRKVSRINMPANAADFRLLDRRVVLAFRRIRERTRFLRGLTSWVGYRSVGIEYDAAARHTGQSKYNLKRMIRFAIDGMVSFSPVPLYLAFYFGFGLAFFGFLYAVYVFYIHFFTKHGVAGWASLIVLVSVIGGVQLITVGLVGVYLGKVYDEVKSRPIYLLQATLGFDETEPR